MINILVVEPNKEPYTMSINENDVTAMNNIVGGYLETIQFDRYVMFLNEDGIRLNLERNNNLKKFNILGTVFICNVEPPEMTSLTDDDVQRCIELLK